MAKRSGLFYITYEGQNTVENIQKQFKGHLSPNIITRKTAFVLNETSRRAARVVQKRVGQEYTMQKKYLAKMAQLSKPASAKRLYAEVSYKNNVFKIQMFKFKQIGKKGGVKVEIKKGHSVLMQHLFVRTMKSGHIGVFGRGKYVKQQFVPGNFKTRNGKPMITDMLTASPYSAALSDIVKKDTITYIHRSLPGRLTAILQQEVNKMK